MYIPGVVLGALLLLFGRKLFWLFVGAVGFVVALGIAAELMPTQPVWVFLLVAVFAGILGAWLAVAIQWLAIGVGGFFAGGYLAAMFLDLSGLQLGGPEWLPFVMGGVIGAILLSALFNPALIGLSSMVGAFLITDATSLAPGMSTVVFLALLVGGILFQTRVLNSGKKEGS